ncbi:TPA: hypothetical protein ROG05_000338 [Enterobacter soli]|nr:hypothetical protein [Enterobacter soli]
MNTFIPSLAVAIIIFYVQPAFCEQGFERVPSGYKTAEGSTLEITNLPKRRSQGSAPICYASVAASIIDYEYCKANNITDCSLLSDDKRVSMIDLSRYNHDLPENVDISDRFNYEGLSDKGSSAVYVIDVARRTQQVAKESCAPESAINFYEDGRAESVIKGLKIKEMLKLMYEGYQEKTKQDKTQAENYANAAANFILAEINLLTLQKDVVNAFKESSFEKFTDMVYVPDICWDIKNQLDIKRNWEIGQSEKMNYAKSIDKIKELLKNKNLPVLGICAEEPLKSKVMKQCSAGHSVYVAGYRKMCGKGNTCVDVIRVINSWGTKWQEDHDDGWVMAKPLLNRGFYEKASIEWAYLTPAPLKDQNKLAAK